MSRIVEFMGRDRLDWGFRPTGSIQKQLGRSFPAAKYEEGTCAAPAHDADVGPRTTVIDARIPDSGMRPAGMNHGTGIRGRSAGKTRVAAYCRVSTLMASQETSIEGQQRHFERLFSQDPEWECAGIFLETGVTGTKAEVRPELQRLLAQCRAGRIDLVLTKSISRFARNTQDCLALVRELNGLGVHLFFEKENIHTGRMESELMLSILACLAADESRSISDNMKWGARKRFQAGTYRGGRVPFGYAREGNELSVVPDEACVVRRVFVAAALGDGATAIADSLNAQRIPAPRGGRWWPSTVRKMLGNPVYAGDLLCQKTFVDEEYTQRVNRGELDRFVVRDHHPAIVSRDLFAAVNGKDGA